MLAFAVFLRRRGRPAQLYHVHRPSEPRVTGPSRGRSPPCCSCSCWRSACCSARSSTRRSSTCGPRAKRRPRALHPRRWIRLEKDKPSSGPEPIAQSADPPWPPDPIVRPADPVARSVDPIAQVTRFPGSRRYSTVQASGNRNPPPQWIARWWDQDRFGSGGDAVSRPTRRPVAGCRRSPCIAGHTGEPGFGALVTGKTSPHRACTNVPITALSAIFALRT